MAYIINRYNGSVLTTVEDGTVNQATELKFIGKNFAGYGEAQNENFLFLLENFSSPTAPTRPIAGQLWYDSSISKIKVYNGSIWKTGGGAEASTTAPVGLSVGELWWDVNTNQLYSQNSLNEWVLIGPQGAGSGLTQMQSLTLVDTVGESHAVIAATIEDIIVYITSQSAFTISTSDAITGFDEIKQGITLVNTQATTAGVTTSDHVFWGTASNALTLNGQEAADFLTTNNASFANVVKFEDPGFTLGNDDDLVVKIADDTITPVIQLKRGVLTIQNAADQDIINITNTEINPTVTNTYALGTIAQQWSNVYATTFNGTSTQSDTLAVSGVYRTATTTASVNTIAARDASGDITATVFRGIATTARYADLAEKYSTKEDLLPGTAVAVCDCVDHEIEPARASSFCIGVISTDPAYMMNCDADGQYVGLKGRLPVRISGPVKKGQAVYAMDNGVCTTIATTALVGISLETNDSHGEKLVECVLKV
jgi:hypothetical protein